MPDTGQRLVAFLAVRSRPQRRSTVAGTLWAETTDDQAAANLRTALWRTRRVDRNLVCSEGGYLRIGDHVRVDLSEMVERVHHLIDDDDADADAAALAAATSSAAVTTAELLSDDLLPDWYEDWVLLERERLRQVRLHGLEALCVRLANLGRHVAAIEAGLAAIAADPLRESAQRALISAHLVEGNVSEAVRQYDVFVTLLDEAFGIAPTDALRALVARWR